MERLLQHTHCKGRFFMQFAIGEMIDCVYRYGVTIKPNQN